MRALCTGITSVVPISSAKSLVQGQASRCLAAAFQIPSRTIHMCTLSPCCSLVNTQENVREQNAVRY